ncbi:hypothetical protein AN216_23075 [Streptomyces oceani]|uniref:Subtilisin inhibitor domain-containing protein n=1 Tax=Streptomyces oceani TaxID=1075402 RepID=A0A1E7JWJ7_9ACTN|nr:hypothetical protein AN216_23075 [Streptomyces oceani]
MTESAAPTTTTRQRTSRPGRTRRLTAVATLATTLALVGVTTGPTAGASEQQKRPAGQQERTDRLSLTVQDSTDRARNGTVTLSCNPSGGDHPKADKACAALAKAAEEAPDGEGPFAPVPEGSNCTMVYGGPVRAQVTGNWHGKPVDAEFSRSNGCEISRWDALVPALPAMS